MNRENKIKSTVNDLDIPLLSFSFLCITCMFLQTQKLLTVFYQKSVVLPPQWLLLYLPQLFLLLLLQPMLLTLQSAPEVVL